MRAGHVGVEVHHLGLEPQPELHPELVHPVDQGAETARPDVGRHLPVTEPGTVVASGAEPAVVQDVTLDPQLGGAFGQRQQLLQVVVEIDRLPDVQRHRPIHVRMLRTASQVTVEPSRDRVQADAVAAVDPRRGVALAVGQDNLAGQQQLTAAQHLDAIEEPFGVVGVIAAPSGVHRPDLTLGEPEPRHTQMQQGGGLGARAAFASLAQVGTDRQFGALRHPLFAPPAGEVEKLTGLAWHREGEYQILDLIAVHTGVRHRGIATQHSADQQFQGDLQLETGVRVGRVHLQQPPGTDCSRLGADRYAVQQYAIADEARRPVSTGPGSAQAGSTDPTGPRLGDDGQPDQLVDAVRIDGRTAGEFPLGEGPGVGRTEIGAPVQDGRQSPSGHVDRDADVLSLDPQHHTGVGDLAHQSLLGARKTGRQISGRTACHGCRRPAP